MTEREITAYMLSAEAALNVHDAAKEFAANQRIRACVGGRWYTGLITSLHYGMSSDKEY